jgi:aminocarboxymuconate-semialdehyde decarboxylase
MGNATLLHRCNPQVAPVKVGTPVKRLPYRTIDVHCHLFAPDVEKLVTGHPMKIAQVRAETESLGEVSLKVNAEMIGTLIPKLTQVEDRLRDMDAMGVDVQVVSPSPTQYYYWAEPDLLLNS